MAVECAGQLPNRPAGRRMRFWRQSPTSLRLGAGILGFHLVLAAVGAVWTPYGYHDMTAGAPLSGISFAHLFGVDQLGRDVFSRVMHGGHIVLLLSLSGAALGLVLGGLLGLLSGYLRGWIDEVIQRLSEALISIPFLVLALLAVVAAGPQLAGDPLLLVGVVALVYVPRVARMARAAALDIVTRDYVTMARVRGESAWSIVRRELLPNTSGVLLVEFALRAGYAPVLIGSLGFLGFGMRSPTPEWGLMISEYRSLIVLSPIVVIGPGLMLASLVIGLNLFTEGLARILGRTVRIGS